MRNTIFLLAMGLFLLGASCSAKLESEATTNPKTAERETPLQEEVDHVDPVRDDVLATTVR